MKEPIAILGIGCRYPQAEGVEAFWRLLVEGGDAIGPYPGGRFSDVDGEYAAAAAGRPSKVATNLGGFLTGIDTFDAAFFGISPREAVYIDPQQRLLLESAWHALEDAGQLKENYEGTRTGVFTGLWVTEHEQLAMRFLAKPEFYMLTGGGRSTSCGRVSFTFGFEGPSVSVDTACSSSMVAVHMACQALREGQCDMALAGGANVILTPDQTRIFTDAKMLAPDGHCKFGDERANGFVRSEGAGMVVLKRLSDAVAAGDPIYAVIHGSSVNNDGRSGGLMVTPSREGQKKMLLEAWREAGITGGQIAYIEAHGTGTRAGDPVELGAIGDALAEAGATGKVPLGSVKTNVGHTESAAGIAGVIKAALVLKEGVIPPSLNHERPNPDVDWDAPIAIVTERRELGRAADGGMRYVGASSFGLTGTNSHMLLGEYRAERETVARGDSGLGGLLLPVSAYSAAALQANVRRWVEFLGRGIAEGWSPEDVAEICYIAGARRTAQAHRFAAVGRDAAELKAQMEAMLAGEASSSPEPGLAADAARKVVFVSPGQGSQWDGMARELYREHAAFREAFDACGRVILAETGWGLVERLESAEAAEYLKQIDFVQPALWAMSVALAAVWRAAGVEPGAVVGHSMGEAAAAYLAGALSLEDAGAVICRRSRLMRRLSGQGAGFGAMASVEMPAQELAGWLEQFEGRVSIAAENAPGTTVVSGASEAVDQLLEWLELKEVFCRRIKVDVASHSVMVDPILAELKEALADLKPRRARVPFFSTVEGRYLEGSELDAEYWVRNLRQPVRLATATTALAAEGFGAFVELSPHAIVVPAVENTLRAVGARDAVALASLVRGAAAGPAMLRSLGRLWIAGGRLDWAGVTWRGDGPVSRRFRLPEYVFERERFWLEEGEAATAGVAKLSSLLRSRVEVGQEPGTTIFNVIADLKTLPFLADHRVGGAVVFPAAAHLEAVMEASREMWPGRAVRIEDVAFQQALYLTEGERAEVQLVVRRVAGAEESFSFALLGRAGEGSWTEHSRGMIRLDAVVADGGAAIADSGSVDSAVPEFAAPDFSGLDLAERQVAGEALYRWAKRAGLDYGPAFQRVERIVSRRLDGVLLAQARVRGGEDVREYLLHPGVLDACFQTMILMRGRIPGLLAEDLYLPSELGRMRMLASPGGLPADEAGTLVAEAVFRSADAERNALVFDLRLKTEDGRELAVFERFKITRAETRGTERRTEDVHRVDWVAARKPTELSPGAAIARHWLIFADWADGADSKPEASLDGAAVSRAGELARRLTAEGGRCTLVWQGKAFRALGDGERRLDLLGADEYELALGDSARFSAELNAARLDADLDRLLGLVAAEAGRISDVLDMWPVGAAPAGPGRVGAGDVAELDAIWAAQGRGAKFVPALVQALTRAEWTRQSGRPPKLWLVTEGTQSVAEAPGPVRLAGSPVWGIAAVAIREHMELRPCLVDLGVRDAAAGAEGREIGDREIEMLLRLVMEERPAAEAEDRVALRGEAVYAERLLPCVLSAKAEEPRAVAAGEAYRVEVGRLGALDELHLRGMETEAPKAGEVAIEIAYGAMNFIDALRALGLYPGLDTTKGVRLGGECSGRVAAVGEGVTEFAVGDAVVGITPSAARVSMLASRAVVPVALVAKVPERLTMEEAGAQPLVYFTAQLALHELARLEKDEWVLIHAGAGGVGLAAVVIAQARGAKVIATVSSEEKRAFLRGWGVEHVLNSRSLDFAEGVLAITGGRGVDVVLNSLSGEFIDRSLEVLAPFGRFVELGKRDIYADKRVGLKVFRKNLAYFVVDMAGIITERPAMAARLLREVMAALESGEWKPVPVKSYPASEVSEAFRRMAQGKHIGKLAIDFTEPDVRILPRRTHAGTLMAPRFRGDGTYVITGGLGGVALEVAGWMARAGAGCLVLVSRREAGAEEHAAMERIRVAGARVEHRRTDITDGAQVRALMSEIGETMPPLRGVLHAAAVIDDALMTDLKAERFDAVFAPKMRGAWYLHETTLGAELDFFVMFSSVATIFPQPGHGSYAAANAFLDAFAAYRRGMGLKAQSICWTGWVNMGLARNAGTSRTIDACAEEGLGSFDGPEATSALWQALWADPVLATAVRVDEDVVRARGVIPTLLREMVGGDETRGAEATEHAALEAVKAAATQAERAALVEELVRTETGRVLKLAPERITANQVFGQLGIDSLMALELVRRINAVLGLALPATAVFNYPTVTQLGAQIVTRLGLDSAVVAEPARVSASVPNVQSAPEELSEEEALRALMEPGDLAGGD
jgi:acyl transferase domain-containing protein/NAD(P)-dependent dehydrogenase (short-subunit alcohol dehydrogenase family)/acyl carrier protein